MLFLNNKWLDLSNPIPEHRNIAKDYTNKIADLKERFGKHITIQSRKKPKINATGLIEPVPNSTIPLHITTVGENGREEWLYCETMPEIKDGIVIPETRQKIIQYGELIIDLDTDPDFAYFLIEKHGMIKSGKYNILDHETDERLKAEHRRKETLLTSVIYGDNAKLNIDVDFLRLIAKRWGIGNADKQGKDTLQNQLFDMVQSAEKQKKSKQAGRGIDDFVKDVRGSDTSEALKVASLVRDAIDAKIVIFDPINRKWIIDYKDGNFKNIMTVSIDDTDQKDEVLILYLQSDNNLFALLSAAMGTPKQKVAEGIDADKIRETEDIAVLRQYAKSLGVTAFQKGKEPLRIELLEKLAETLPT